MKRLLLLMIVIFLCSVPMYAEKKPIDKELDYFWGKKRKVEVIEKRLFLREGRHEFTFFSGTIPNDDFFLYYPIGLRYNYYFSEDLSLEIHGAWLFNSKSDLEGFLENEDVFDVKVYLPERLQFYGFVSGVYSPFHGKLSVFNIKLAHFDINIAAGLGVMGLRIKKDKKESMSYQPAGSLGLGFRFYLNDWVALRLDYRHYFYKSDEYNGLSWPAELTFGVSLFTKAPK